jgi:hypothetical protein
MDLPKNSGGAAGGGAAALGSDNQKTVQIAAGGLVDVSGGNSGQGAQGVIVILGSFSADNASASLIGGLGLYPDGISAGDFFAVGGGGGGGGSSDGLPLATPEIPTFALFLVGMTLVEVWTRFAGERTRRFR